MFSYFSVLVCRQIVMDFRSNLNHTYYCCTFRFWRFAVWACWSTHLKAVSLWYKCSHRDHQSDRSFSTL